MSIHVYMNEMQHHWESFEYIKRTISPNKRKKLEVFQQ